MKLRIFPRIFCGVFLVAGVVTGVLVGAETDPAGTPLAEAVKAYAGGDTETARMLFEAVLAEDPGNRTARTYLGRIQGQAGARKALRNQMEAMVLPTVKLQDVAAREAFLYVSQQVEKRSGGKKHLNVVWLAPSEAGNRITLTLQNIPVSEVLRYLAAAADLRVVYDRNAIKVLPAQAQ